MLAHRQILLGDWSRLVRDPLDLLRLAFLLGAVVALVLGHLEPSLRLLLTFLAAVLARAIDLPRPFDLVFLLGMALQAFGNVLGAFDHVYGYDKVVHFTLPAAMSTLLYLLAIRLRVLPDLSRESGILSGSASSWWRSASG